MKQFFLYFTKSRQELNHVKWPTKKQLVELTILVLAVSLIMGAFTGILDSLFQEGYNLLLKLAGK